MTETTKTPIILLVDDDSFLLDMYKIKFEKGGYAVKLALGSEESLTLLRGGFVPDIIITDVVMPTIDGIEMIALIRKEQLANGAMVVTLSNQSSAQDIERAKKVGVDGYIIKATTIPSEVYEHLHKMYEGHKKS